MLTLLNLINKIAFSQRHLLLIFNPENLMEMAEQVIIVPPFYGWIN